MGICNCNKALIVSMLEVTKIHRKKVINAQIVSMSRHHHELNLNFWPGDIHKK